MPIWQERAVFNEMRAGVATAIFGVIGITIVNSVVAGVDTSSWSTAEIALVALFGLMIAAGVIMALVSYVK